MAALEYLERRRGRALVQHTIPTQAVAALDQILNNHPGRGTNFRLHIHLALLTEKSEKLTTSLQGFYIPSYLMSRNVLTENNTALNPP